MSAPAIEIDRRGFLTGFSLVLTGLPLQALAGSRAAPGKVQESVKEKGQGSRALFQQMPYYNFEGSGESFDPSRSNSSTRNYVNSLSREEYLRRHLYT